ncbi:TPM domain-containing protein [Enterococcus ureasiticus]|uniref:TPM domain-containing protein n=1 Tax=Enterococcus ureasiticus TaxID=903984 RepID=A0A1E5GAC3_9ENTE|nr:TPM domain-containing protein [Enterococcus ureasiticus]OEG09607.1 hypothetical protein BCR21_14775 [Enterococcus ureasiticus]
MKKMKKEQHSVSLNWYKRYKKRFSIRYVIAWISLVIGILFSILLFLLVLLAISDYNDSKKQINELTKERSALREKIQHSATDEQLKNFEQTQASLISGWSNNEDNYIVDVYGQEIAIDRNNIFVSDNAKVLKNDTKKKIYQINKEFSQFNDGQQFMIVTIQSLPEYTTIETFASEVFNQLGIGQADKNNGILYVMSIDDRKTRIEVGYGLEATVSDAQAGSILDDEDTVSDFKDKAYDQGVSRIIDQLYAQIGSITPEYDLKIKDAKELLSNAKAAIIVFVICIFICLLTGVLFMIQAKKLKQRMNQLSDKEIYYLYLSAPIFIFTIRGLKKMISTGQVMSKHAGAKRKGTNVLVGNRLYDSSGYIITRDYTSYSSSSSIVVVHQVIHLVAVHQEVEELQVDGKCYSGL